MEILTAKQSRAGRAVLAWSQRDLAEAAQVGISTVADFERGSRTPVAISATAIRGALEAAGVRFVAGGVAEAQRPRDPGPRQSGSPIRWIDSTDLANWANRRDGQSGMPELVSRLILASFGLSADVCFPAGDSVQQGGWDGRCQLVVGDQYVPSGSSGWEIGVQREGIKAKADADFATRTKSPGDLNPVQATFVFVTPRSWSRKDVWAKQRRAEKKWADVRVLDADTLVHWIDHHPAVAAWFATKIGRRPSGVIQLSDLWNEWSLVTSPPLATDLILTGRDAAAARIHKWLREPPSVLTIQAEAIDEGFAFLWAALGELPESYHDAYLCRTLVAGTDEAARSLGDAMSPLILAMNGDNRGLAQSLAGKGHHVYAVVGPDSHPLTNVVLLEPPRRGDLRQALIAMHVPDAKAEQLSRHSGRSLVVLRRAMAEGSGRAPWWALGVPSRALVAAVLAGAWDESSNSDKEIISKIAGEPYEDVERDLAPLANVIDGPLRRSGTKVRLASARDAWFLIGPYLSRADVQRYFNAFAEVLGSVDPRFALSGEERWLAPIRGVTPPYSRELQRGLTDTLNVMAALAERAPNVPDLATSVDRAVSDLLKAADGALWWSLSLSFQGLSEAAPRVFLERLKDALAADPCPLRALLIEDTNSALFIHEHLSDLLWALERLAWSVDYLAPASDILAALAEIDPGGRYQNRPANSLRQIFVSWSPQTYAKLAERLKAIDGLRLRYPSVAWALLISLAPRLHDTSSNSPHPQWRDFSDEGSETITHSLVAKSTQEVLDRLLHDVGTDSARWIQLLELLPALSKAQRAVISATFSMTAVAWADHQERLAVWTAIRRVLNRHRQHPNSHWAMQEDELAPLQEAYDSLEPPDVIDRYAWLFSSDAGPPRPETDWTYAEKLLEELRGRAAGVLMSHEDPELLLRMASALEYPYLLGAALPYVSGHDAIQQTILNRAIRSESPKEAALAHGLVSCSQAKFGAEWGAALLQQAIDQHWGTTAIVRILHALPANMRTWQIACEAGPTVENAYWGSLHILALRGDADDVAYAARKLLAVARAYDVVHLLGNHGPVGFPSDLLLEALRRAPDEIDGPQNSNDSSMFGYYVAKMLDQLEKDQTVPRSELVRLEWLYFPVLEHSERPPRVLEMALATEPSFFVTVLSAVYRPAEGSESQEPAPDDLDRIRQVAEQGYTLLQQWTRVPGTKDSGELDASFLNSWVAEARRLSAVAHRVDIGDQHIGGILSAATPDSDGSWPPSAVRAVIEEAQSAELEVGFIVGVGNRRGVTTRGPFDGGEQERDIARRYRDLARQVAVESPRTSRLLTELAKSYAAEGLHMDRLAEETELL